jgi:GDPmannose 4,6-dehydratase
MAILVTGGSGLVGAILTRFLVEKGEYVWVFDKWKGVQRFLGIEDRVKIIQGDLGNFSQVLETVKASAPQVIYHLGGMLSLPCNADPQSAFSSNVAGTFHVLQAARIQNATDKNTQFYPKARGSFGFCANLSRIYYCGYISRPQG